MTRLSTAFRQAMNEGELRRKSLPPNDRNQGRKPIKEGQSTVSMTIRLTAGQREKLSRLGGAAWIRDRIDMAKILVDSQK